MAVYKYVGRTKKGNMKRGTIEAINKTQAIAKLREQGISPREINEAKGLLNKEITIGNPVKQQDFVIYCRQFATLIRAGVSIVDSTNILAKQTDSKYLAKVLVAIEDDLRSGISFSEAAEKHPKVFPQLFINMVRAGEASGNLDETLDRIATHMEKQYDLKKKVQSTMTYPIVLLVVIIAVVVFMMLTIIPSFVEMFESMGSELPAITKFMLSVSSSLQNYWFIWLLFILGIIIVFSVLMKKNKEFNYSVHVAMLKMPIFGKLLQKSAIARMTRTLSSLFTSSVPILQALTIVEKVIGNPVISKVVLEARDSLEKGNRLSEPFEESWVIPPLVTSMTAIGEETGTLDYMLEKIADFYEAEVDRSVDSLKSLIEPVMILIMAVVVGIIVLSILIPMFSMYSNI
ncbi:type II secretion system F family protein [Pallidibacillus pasinlerensis]|uniref:Type II secretion system F family protein n=1 Tax=Pallidibacillus pasinlerensis TaxID=2703818 RepID=A0ABX0A0K1_9BACI|nr:type II secretion system F family protein [Pallidibacillus pasinlerensis]NCU16940.1 type II secretion system F family protein [Pallidibacillus pasinlerensis]